MQNSNHNILLIVVGFVFSLIFALVPIFVVPSFQTVFASFGADLPLITRILVEHPYVFFLIPILVLIVGFFSPYKHRRAFWACIIGTTSWVWATALLVFAMYFPIWSLAAA